MSAGSLRFIGAVVLDAHATTLRRAVFDVIDDQTFTLSATAITVEGRLTPTGWGLYVGSEAQREEISSFELAVIEAFNTIMLLQSERWTR